MVENMRGEHKNGKYHGKGTYTYADGSKYIGEFKDNMLNGKGNLCFRRW